MQRGIRTLIPTAGTMYPSIASSNYFAGCLAVLPAAGLPVFFAPGFLAAADGAAFLADGFFAGVRLPTRLCTLAFSSAMRADSSIARPMDTAVRSTIRIRRSGSHSAGQPT